MRACYIYTVILAILIAGNGLRAADYYVNTGGNDAAAGSSAAPWRTVAKVNGRNLAAGDRVFFAGGQTFSDAGLYLDSADSGSATDPIEVGSYGSGRATLQPPTGSPAVYIYNTAGIQVSDLILRGPGLAASDADPKSGFMTYCDLAGGVKLAGLRVANLDVSGFHEGITIGAWHSSFSGFEDVVITGCLVHDNLANGISTYGYQPGSASQQSHVNLQILDCEVTRNYGDPTLSNPGQQHSGSGIIVSGCTSALIDRCYAHHNGGGAGDNSGGGPVGIWGYSTNGLVIQRSLVHDQRTTPGAVDGGGFDIDGGSTNSIIQYCYAYENEGPAVLICEYTGGTPLQNAVCRYNIGWRNGTRNGMGGFHFYNGENLASELQDVDIYNNLIVADNDTCGPAVVYQSGPLAGIRFRNNIFVVNGGERLVDIGSNTAAFTFQGNVWWAIDGNWSGGWHWGGSTYSSLASWRAAAGAPETLAGGPVGLQADPLVASLLAGSRPTSVAAMEAMSAFRLLAGSPCRESAQDLRAPAFGALSVGSRDFFGASLPRGRSFDVGPHEAAPELSLVRAQFGHRSSDAGWDQRADLDSNDRVDAADLGRATREQDH